MKKIAIVGTSNAILATGYAKKVKHILDGECDIYALGSATSLYGAYVLLKH